MPYIFDPSHQCNKDGGFDMLVELLDRHILPEKYIAYLFHYLDLDDLYPVDEENIQAIKRVLNKEILLRDKVPALCDNGEIRILDRWDGTPEQDCNDSVTADEMNDFIERLDRYRGMRAE
jgi:hypothetical protein